MISQSQADHTPQIEVTSVDPDTNEPTQKTVDLSQTVQESDQKIRGFGSEIDLLTDSIEELTNKKHLLGHLRARNRGNA